MIFDSVWRMKNSRIKMNRFASSPGYLCAEVDRQVSPTSLCRIIKYLVLDLQKDLQDLVREKLRTPKNVFDSTKVRRDTNPGNSDCDKYRWDRPRIKNPLDSQIPSFGISWDSSSMGIWSLKEFWLSQSRSMGHKSLGLFGLGQKSLGQFRDFELWDLGPRDKNRWDW